MDQSSTLMAAVQQLLTSVQSLDQSISPSKNDKVLLLFLLLSGLKFSAVYFLDVQRTEATQASSVS